MAVDLFAGIPVSDYPAALDWYEKLLGSPPSFLPNDVEAVWELAEHRYVYVEKLPDHAGHAMLTVFVDDLDVRVAAAAEWGSSRRSGRHTRTASARSRTAIPTATRSASAAARCDGRGRRPRPGAAA